MKAGRATRLVSLLLSFFFWGSQGYALQPEPDAVFARVIDSGPALCVAVVMPKGHYMIYDAGNWVGGGAEAYESVAEIIPEGSTIDLMVLSHSDSDHLGAVDEICDAYRVKRIIRSGFKRSTGTWRDADSAIKMERETDNCIDINLRYFEFPHGATYRFEDVFVTMVCGFHTPPEEWGVKKGTAEYRNAGSIVIRLQYRDKSILFCGDTVGRHIGDPDDTCIVAENFMVENASVIKIDSDVLIAPHHGADNANSLKFIQAVSPEYVIFSAGHKYAHPRATAVTRFFYAGIKKEKMFRTDRGDDEGADEWNDSHRISGHKDPSGDDDVDILIRSDGSIVLEYRNP